MSIGASYPHCDRYVEREAERDTISEFLDYCRANGFVLCETVEKRDWNDYYPLVSSREDDLILRSLDIDPKALEEERRQMLRDIREHANIQRSA